MSQTESPSGAAPLETRDIGVSGMTCDHCVRRVEKALRAKSGVKEVHVDRQAAQAKVTFDASQTSLAELHAVLQKSGYPATTPV